MELWNKGLPEAVQHGLEKARKNGHQFSDQCTYGGKVDNAGADGWIVFQCTNLGCQAQVRCNLGGTFSGDAPQNACLFPDGNSAVICIIPENSNAPAEELALFSALVAYYAETPEPLPLLEAQCRNLFPQAVIDRNNTHWQILYEGKYTDCPSVYLDIPNVISHEDHS